MCWFMVKNLGMIIWQPLVCLHLHLHLFACRTYQDWVRVHSGWILQINDGSQVFLLFSTSEQKIEEGFSVWTLLSLRRYLVKVPAGYPLEKAGPILCAGKNDPYPPSCDFDWETSSGTEGITMYSPLSHWSCLGGGKRVGIVGIGGLGQMGVRLTFKNDHYMTIIVK